MDRSTLRPSTRGLGLAVRRVSTYVRLAGGLALSLASAPVFAQFAYVPNGADRTVSVINTLTNTVAATIVLPSGPTDTFPLGVAVNPAGTRVYVTNTCSHSLPVIQTACRFGDPGSVSVINTSTNMVIKTIPLPYSPVGIAVTHDGKRVYVVSSSCGFLCSSFVSVIDVRRDSDTENKVIRTIPLPDPDGRGIAVNYDGSRIYVSNLHNAADTSGAVDVINTDNYKVTSIPVPSEAFGIALNSNRPRLYVASFLNRSISVIDTKTNTSVNTTTTSCEACIFVAVKPDGTRLYVGDAVASSNNLGGSVRVIETTDDNLTVLATIDTPLPVGLSVHPDGTRVYATNFAHCCFGLDNTVSVINTATNTIPGSPITVGNEPTGFGFFIGPVSLRGLISLIESFSLKPSVESALLDELDDALGKESDERDEALSELRDFIKTVNGLIGKGLTSAQAAQIVQYTNEIIAVLSVKLDTSSPAHTAPLNVSAAAVTPLQSLAQVITIIDQNQGINTTSDPKLQDLQTALAAENLGQRQNATTAMTAFITDTNAQVGHGLTDAEATLLVAAANEIIHML